MDIHYHYFLTYGFAKYALKQVEIKLVNVIYTGYSKSKCITTY
jgi:hypothetical protein